MLVQELLRAGRALINAKQNDLAERAKISLATLNNFERGVSYPRQKTWERIISAFLREGVEIFVNAREAGVRLKMCERLPDLTCQHILQDIQYRIESCPIIPVKNIVLCYSALPKPHFFVWLDYGVRSGIFDRSAFTMDSAKASQELADLIIFCLDRHIPLWVLNTLRDVKKLDPAEAVSYLKKCPTQVFEKVQDILKYFHNAPEIVKMAAQQQNHALTYLIQKLDDKGELSQRK